MMIRIVLALALAVVVSGADSAIYKWVDEKGVTHYSESPPPGRKAEQIRTQPSPAPPVQDAGPAVPAPKSWQEKEAEFQQRRAAEEEARMKREAQAQSTAVERLRACTLARQNLHALEQERAVYSIDEKGDRVYIDDKERDQVRERLRKTIQENCESK